MRFIVMRSVSTRFVHMRSLCFVHMRPLCYPLHSSFHVIRKPDSLQLLTLSVGLGRVGYLKAEREVCPTLAGVTLPSVCLSSCFIVGYVSSLRVSRILLLDGYHVRCTTRPTIVEASTSVCA